MSGRDGDSHASTSSSTLAERRQSRFLSTQPPSSSLNTRRRSSVLALQPSSSTGDNKRSSQLYQSQISPSRVTFEEGESPPPSATSSSTSWEEKQARRASLAVVGTGSDVRLGATSGTGQGKRSSQLQFDEVKGRRGSLMYEEGVKNVRRNSLRQQLEERRASVLHQQQDTSHPPPVGASSSNRRQSLFVADDGSSTLSQRRSSLLFDPRTRAPPSTRDSRPMEEMEDHTAITLAQRRRSSLLHNIGVGGDRLGGGGGNSLLGRLSIAVTSPLRSSFSSGGTTPSPYRPTFREQEKIDEKRTSYSLNALSQAHKLHARAGKRTLRKNLMRVTLLVMILFAFSKIEFVKKRYPTVDLVLGDWEAEVDSLLHRGSAPKAKPIEKQDLPSDWAEHLDRNVPGFREEFIWKPVDKAEEVETFVVPQQEGSTHEQTIIFLHGLAQTFFDSPLPSQLGERFPNVKWVMPQAPLKPITVRDDTTHAWFDMLAFPYVNALDEDPSNLFFSARQINSVIAHERSILIKQLRARGGLDKLSWDERKGYTFVEGDGDEVGDGELGTIGERKWAMKKIVLSGFSQGSVMTMLTGLTTREPLAGIVLISSFMPLRKTLGTLIRDLDRKDLPVFWGHGQQDIYLTHEDAITSIELMRATTPNSEGLGGLGLENLEFHSYPGLEHTWWPGEMDHLAEWLGKVLPPKAAMKSKP